MLSVILLFGTCSLETNTNFKEKVQIHSISDVHGIHKEPIKIYHSKNRIGRAVVHKKMSKSEVLTQKYKQAAEASNHSSYRVNDIHYVSREALLKTINRNGNNVLSSKVDIFIEAGVKEGIDPATLVAIAVNETSYGTTFNVKERKNVGGIRCVLNANTKKRFHITGCQNTKYGKFSTFKSIDDSIKYKAFLLKNSYVNKGLTTIHAIGNKYAPSNDKHDTKGVNNYWVDNVSTIVASIINKPL